MCNRSTKESMIVSDESDCKKHQKKKEATRKRHMTRILKWAAQMFAGPATFRIRGQKTFSLALGQVIDSGASDLEEGMTAESETLLGPEWNSYILISSYEALPSIVESV